MGRSRNRNDVLTSSGLATAFAVAATYSLPKGGSYANEDGRIDDGGLERADRTWHIGAGSPCAVDCGSLADQLCDQPDRPQHDPAENRSHADSLHPECGW